MLQSKLRQIGTTLAALTTNCYHYFRPVQKFPAIIWAETGEENSFHADNGKAEQRIVGTVDCFTRTEFDSLLDDIQGAFEALGLTWKLDAVQYETETKLIHYSWTWGVVADGETQTSGS